MATCQKSRLVLIHKGRSSLQGLDIKVSALRPILQLFTNFRVSTIKYRTVIVINKCILIFLCPYINVVLMVHYIFFKLPGYHPTSRAKERVTSQRNSKEPQALPGIRGTLGSYSGLGQRPGFCRYVYIYIYEDICMYTYCITLYYIVLYCITLYACMHVCMYACMHVCMYACMYVCTVV